MTRIPVIAATPADGTSTNRPAGAGYDQKEIDHLLPEIQKQRRGMFNRLHLTGRKHRNVESGIKKAVVESEARRDTPLERSRRELEQMRATPVPTPTVVTTISSASPKPNRRWSSKLQKRGSSRAKAEAAGIAVPSPVPENAGLNGVTPDRPHTSDGVIGNGIEGSLQTHPTNGTSEQSPRSKRFMSRFHTHARHETVDVGIARSTFSDDGRSTSIGSIAVKGAPSKRTRFPLLKRALGLRQ
jgi:hypothetical protein